MAASGWYPDPGGTPGRYRYWDGASWSTELTDDPADPPPADATQLRTRRPARQERSMGTGFGIAALVLVVVVVSAVLIIKRTDEAGSVDLDPSPPSASGWDDSSPVPKSQPGSPAASADRTGTPDQLSCTDGQPDRLSPHPEDDRTHGGRLSMPEVPGYSPPDPEYMLSWMYDTQGVDQTTEPGWQSLFAVGEVTRTAGFDTPRAAAQSSMKCALTNSWYYSVSGRKDIRDESIMIDGRPGWILTAEIREDNPEIEVEGDQLTFVAVDDGREDALSMWCGMVPLGDEERIALDQRVLAGLKIES